MSVTISDRPQVGMSAGAVEFTDGMSPGALLIGVGLPLDGTPQVGISPATAKPDRAHVKAIAIKNRRIDVSPFFEVQAMQTFLHRIGSYINATDLAGGFEANYYPVCNRSKSSIAEFLKLSCELPLQSSTLLIYLLPMKHCCVVVPR